MEFILLALLAYGIFWIWMLLEIARRPESVYHQAGQSKALWLVVVLVLQFFGTMGYGFLVRGRLRTTEKESSPALRPTN